MIEVKSYRGHIRNWAELCKRFSVDPALPRAERDAAILINGFSSVGTKLPNMLRGMFAFALYDTDTDTLTCVRDQFGTKPFYYYLTGDKELLYGTMIRDIMNQNGFEKELNLDMLQIYLSLTYVGGEDTFFKGIKKLMPGHYLQFHDGCLTITRYWKPEFKPDRTRTLEDFAEEIHNTVQQAMQEIKTEDETAESFLSGGVDSSYVLAMSDAKRADSCGYDEERFDESRIAAETAKLLGVEHCVAKITPEQYFSVVSEVMYKMEQPLGDASAIVFALGCKATAQHTKLCYSGEGADEFFGGYNMYRNAERYGDNLRTFYAGNTNIMKEDEKQRILRTYNPDVLPIRLVEYIYNEDEGLDPLTVMSDVDIRLWLEGDIYLNVDKMSTAAGLEIRMPLTDLTVFSIAAAMPPEFKVNSEQNKVAFRTAAAKVLPEEIAFRKKLGFIVPIRIWLADEKYNSDVRRLLFGSICAEYFKPEEIKAIYDEYIGGNSDLWRKIWTIYTFLVWYEEYFVKR